MQAELTCEMTSLQGSGSGTILHPLLTGEDTGADSRNGLPITKAGEWRSRGPPCLPDITSAPQLPSVPTRPPNSPLQGFGAGTRHLTPGSVSLTEPSCSDSASLGQTRRTNE